jgi:hypothetical protein
MSYSTLLRLVLAGTLAVAAARFTVTPAYAQGGGCPVNYPSCTDPSQCGCSTVQCLGATCFYEGCSNCPFGCAGPQCGA